MPTNVRSSELLREVGRVVAGGGGGRLAELAAKVDDWDGTLALALEHRVSPFLYRALSDANAGLFSEGQTLPAKVQTVLEAEYRNNMWLCMGNARELVLLLDALRCESIAAMPFKGVALAAAVYGDYAARNSGDLDLLIRYEDLARATALLQARGYVLETKVREDGTPAVEDLFEYQFGRPADGMMVELRWRLQCSVRPLRRDPGMDWVWPGRGSAMLAGMAIPEMQREQTLLLLCMHGSKHVWGRLIWICDVARALVAEPALDWDEVERQAGRIGLQRVLAFSVLVARRVTGVAVPGEVLRRFERDRTAVELARYIDENLFVRTGRAPGRRVTYDFYLLDWSDRVRVLLSPEFLRPTHADRAFVHLPKPFDVLYPLVRPVRMLFDKALRM